MIEQIEIREASPEDAAAILDYYKIVGGETHNLSFGSEGKPISLEEEKVYLADLLAAKRSVAYLALLAGEIIAKASISNFSRERLKHKAYVAISVKRDYWGVGIGTLLMEKLITFAQKAGLELLTLDVLSENQRAISIYEKLGFERYGRLEKSNLIEGKYYSTDAMKLDL